MLFIFVRATAAFEIGVLEEVVQHFEMLQGEEYLLAVIRLCS